jgi:hypothetical protein
MGEPDRDAGAGRYWKIRTAAELIKLGAWFLWKYLRDGSPMDPR